jgi:uncharacterized protein (TIGR03067 family)
MYQGVLVGTMAILIAAQAEDSAKEDADVLQGTWRLVALERDGEKVPDRDVERLDQKLVIAGKEFALTKGGRTTIDGDLALDAIASPKRVVFRGTDRQLKGKGIVSGIYKCEGDTLTLCTARPFEDARGGFSTKATDGRTLEVYRREKGGEESFHRSW